MTTRRDARSHVVAVEVHHLGEGGGEVPGELLAGVVRGVDLGQRPELGVGPEHQVDAASRSSAPSRRRRDPRRSRRRPRSASRSCRGRAGSRRSRCVSTPGRSVSTPCDDSPAFAPSTRRPPTSTVISGALSVSRLARSIELVLRRGGAGPCRGSSGTRRPPAPVAANDSTSVCSWVASVRPGVNGTVTSYPGLPRGLLDRRGAGQHDQVGERDALVVVPVVERLGDALERAERRWRAGRGRSPPSRSAARAGCDRRSRHRACRCRGTSTPTPMRSRPAGRSDSPESSTCCFSAATSASSMTAYVASGTGSCQISTSPGTSGPRYRWIGPMSRWVSLNQARANASANSSGFSWKRFEISARRPGPSAAPGRW